MVIEAISIYAGEVRHLRATLEPIGYDSGILQEASALLLATVLESWGEGDGPDDSEGTPAPVPPKPPSAKKPIPVPSGGGSGGPVIIFPSRN